MDNNTEKKEAELSVTSEIKKIEDQNQSTDVEEEKVIKGTTEEIDQQLDEEAKKQKIDFDDVKKGTMDTIDKVANSEIAKATSSTLKTGLAAFKQILIDPMKPVKLSLGQSIVFIVLAILSFFFMFYMFMQAIGKAIIESIAIFSSGVSVSPSLGWSFISALAIVVVMIIGLVVSNALGHLKEQEEKSSIVLQGLVLPTVFALASGITVFISIELSLVFVLLGFISFIISLVYNTGSINHYLKLIITTFFTLVTIYVFVLTFTKTMADTSVFITINGAVSPLKLSDVAGFNLLTILGLLLG